MNVRIKKIFVASTLKSRLPHKLAKFNRTQKKMMRRFSSRVAVSSTIGKLAKRSLSGTAPSAKLFDKILIANRGEIACRVIRTAKRLGIQTVAVYSDADQNAEHVRLADESFYLGPSPASQSYLLGAKIIEACKATGAQAVHPGYGFLSENLNFCELCEKANVVFIGPPPGAIRAMGSKSESKTIMIAAGVPVTPGYHGDDNSDDTLLKEARKVGWPLMIKAVAGGGGKGMRTVLEESKFLESLESCRRESLKSFGDDAVLLEKLVVDPRHVELQIFGDTFGHVVHLLERDCSVQRRHQKVLEEAPAHSLDPVVRKAMGDAAVACAKAVGYVGAGTVEFLVDPVTQDFYFCEMNTRLQVEHPVTEMVTGLDLVELQLRVASGQRLALSQEEVIARSRGCAVEARIYAENPQNDFLPASGRLVHLRTPIENANYVEEGVRVDSGVVAGNTVSTFYDPMIAKLIAFADTRPEALAKLERALRCYQVAGLANNIDFLVKVVRHPGFATEVADTGFFGRHMTEILTSLSTPSVSGYGEHTSFGIASYLEAQKQPIGSGLWSGAGSGSSVSSATADWRNQRPRTRSLKVVHPVGGSTSALAITVSGADSVSISATVTPSATSADGAHVHHVDHSCVVKSRTLVAESSEEHANFSVWDNVIEINGRVVSGTTSIYTNKVSGNKTVDVWINGSIGDNASHFQFTLPAASFAVDGAQSSNTMAMSPMPGKIIQVVAKEGARVKKGDAIAILEAMKMEHVVYAPCSG